MTAPPLWRDGYTVPLPITTSLVVTVDLTVGDPFAELSRQTCHIPHGAVVEVTFPATWPADLPRWVGACLALVASHITVRVPGGRPAGHLAAEVLRHAEEDQRDYIRTVHGPQRPRPVQP